MGTSGKHDVSRLTQGVKSSSDVHTIAEDIVTLGNDVTEVYGDPKLELGLVCYTSITSGHSLLNLGCASNCVNDAGKLCNQAVTSRLNNPPRMFGDFGSNEPRHMGLESCQRTFFIHAH